MANFFRTLIFGSLALAAAAFVSYGAGACLFVVWFEDFPGGHIEFDGRRYEIAEGARFKISGVVVRGDSDLQVVCNAGSDQAGYITPHADVFVFVRVRGCSIVTYYGK